MKKNILLFILPLLLMAIPSKADPGARLILVRSGLAKCRIILPESPLAVEKKAADVLREYIKKISGAEPALGMGQGDSGECRIVIASDRRRLNLPVAVDWAKLAADGFWIKTAGWDIPDIPGIPSVPSILICGGSGRGAVNGVYSFLETYLGCRKYSPEVEVIPRRRTLDVPAAIDDLQVPRISFRDASIYDPGYMEWHKLCDHDHLFGMYVHTFNQLLPPEKYFAAHPEYFSLTPGGRVANGQLCLTNPDVLHLVIEELRRRMVEKPDVRYWSVSQNDTFLPCNCDNCRRINEAEGSPSGSLLAFVNRVADAFPDKIISTLAYQYSRAAPKNIRPRDNVNIMLCSIECNRSRPIAVDPGSESFRRDLTDWTRLTRNIYLWDYVAQFRNLVSPFPNLRVLQGNLSYFADNGIHMIFEQGAFGVGSEFRELRLYLLSKLLWNPDADIAALLDDFLPGYYGPAAPWLRRYIDAMHDALAAAGEDLDIFGNPRPAATGYLSPAMMDEYQVYFDRAEALVAHDRELLRRVRLARLPLQYALLEQAKIYGKGNRGFFRRSLSGTWRVDRRMEDALRLFVSRCRRFAVQTLDELGTTPEAYGQEIGQWLHDCMPANFALERQVRLKFPASEKYLHGAAAALTDGLRGNSDYRMNWLGFEGIDMEAFIDLQKPRVVREISAGFLQDNNAWIFLPLRVEFAVSRDGVDFTTQVALENPTPATTPGSFAVSFGACFRPVVVRYIRLRVRNMKTCPPWHKGAGGLAWIFCDEVIVK